MDGLVYNTGLRPNALDFRQLAIGAMDMVRDAGMFEHMVFVSPSSNTIVPPLGVHLEQVRMRKGTVIYGILATASSSASFTFTVWRGNAPGTVLMRGCYARRPFGASVWNQGVNNPNYTILSAPYICPDDSPVSVQVSNPSATVSITPQILLICAQPLPALQALAGRYCK